MAAVETTAVFTTVCKHSFVVQTFANGEAMVAPLSPCCNASAKGSANSETGVVCRSCFRDLPASFGGAAMMSDLGSVHALIRGFLSCNHPRGCTANTVWEIEQFLESIETE